MLNRCEPEAGVLLHADPAAHSSLLRTHAMEWLMRRLFAMWCVAGLLASTQAAAVSVDQATFKKHGGKLSDVRGSIRDRHVLDELRAQSFSKPWQSVGFILVAKSWCSATWIGEEDARSYILTAAHCIPYQGRATPMSVAFHGYDAAAVAVGSGTAYSIAWMP